MTLKKSMISIAAASLLAVGFTGCDTSSTSTTSSAIDNKIEQNAYTASVTGAVMNDMGNPVEGAKVYLAGQETTTNAGGLYNFTGVNISDYVTNNNNGAATIDAANASASLLTVSVTAPSGSNYNNAFATVTTEMIHIENVGEDQVANAGSTGGTINVQPNSQSFTVNADVGRVMLSSTIATVTGTVRDVNTGNVVPEGTKIIATYTAAGVNLGAGPTTAGFANTTTGVNAVTGTIGANGVFTLTNLLTSSQYNFTIEGYTAENVAGAGVTNNGVVGINTTASASYADGGFATNTGNVLVSRISANDTISPYIVANAANSEITPYTGVAHPIDAAEGMVIYAEGIDGTSGNEFLINLTEAIDGNKIKTDSLIVFNRTTSTVVDSSMTLLANNQTLSITTATAIPQSNVLEFRLRRSDFTDASGNILNTIAGAFNANAGFTSSAGAVTEIQGALTGNQFAVLNASTYTIPAMGLTPPVVPTSAQNAGTNVDLTVSGYSNPAFNSVASYNVGTSTVLNNMNAANAVVAELSALAAALDAGTTVNQDATTITFDVDTSVTTYFARVVNANNAVIGTARIRQTTGADLGAGALITPTTATVPTNALVAAGTELKHGTNIVNTFLVDLGAALATGDTVEIYSVNDFGDSSLATKVVLTDNTPITTVINTAGVSNTPGAVATVDVVGAGAPAGATGNLLDQGTAGSGGGLPLLYVRADMLESAFAAKDTNLRNELTGADDIYDAAAFTAMTTARSIGMQISEPAADLTNLTASAKVLDSTGTSVNNITNVSTGTNAGSQVVALTVSDIFAMQNYSSVTLAGTTDAAGNVAGSQAANKLYDAMPPLMKSATVNNNSVSFTFTENISLIQTGAGIASLISLTDGGALSDYTFATDVNGNVTVARNTNYEDHKNDNTIVANTKLETTTTNLNGVLTITLSGTVAGAAVTADLSNFFADVHGAKNAAGADNTVATGSSVATFTNVPDTKTSAAGVAGTNNSWANSADNLVVVPTFSVSETITPSLEVAAGAINPTALAADQQFVHAVRTTGALHNTATAGNAADGDWVPGDTPATADTYTIEVQFREPVTSVAGDATKLFGNNVDYDMTVATTGNTYQITTPKTVNVKAGTFDTLQFTFAKIATSTGNVQAGDALVITGVQDASGNIANVTVTLGATDAGISVNSASYKK